MSSGHVGARWLTALLLVTFVVSACGGATAPAGSAAASAAAPAPAGSVAPASLKTRILVTITDRCCINYIPALAGARLGVFESAGLDVEWVPQVPGAAPAMAATLGGQADITVISAAGAVAAAGAGRPARIMSGENFDSFLSATAGGVALQPKVAQALAAKGVTAASSWQDKLKALRGLRFFSNSAGGPKEIRIRQVYASLGMDADKDIVMQAGTPETGNAAWRAGQIDVFTCCEPDTFLLVPDAVVWIKPGEITLKAKGYGTIFATTVDYATKNPEVIKRVLAAQAKMRAMIKAANPGTKERDDILKALQAQYPSVPAALIATSFDTGKSQFDIDNVPTRQDLQDTIDGYNEGASATSKVNLKADDLVAPGVVLK